MDSRLRKISCRILACVCFIPLACSLLAALDGRSRLDVTGTWDVTVTSQEGTAHPSITLRQDGEKLTGTYSGKMGDASLQGRINGSDIRLSFTLKFQDVSYTVTYTGTATENTMQGTARFGDAGTGNWSAKRRKDQD